MNGPLRTDILEFAHALDRAQQTARPIPGGTGTLAGLDDAYAVQDALVGLRLARGERVTGVKLGFTSPAKMRQMGVHEVICGRITDGMLVADGGSVDVSRLIHPRVEPEVAFLLKRNLGAGAEETLPADAIAAIAPALEIIDSRYEAFRFDLAEVVADNASAAGYAVGAWREPTDLADLPVVLETDGRATRTGSTEAILGHPLRALEAAARLAARTGLTIEAGTTVLAGAATEAVPLRSAMRVAADIAGVGRVEVSTPSSG